MSIEFKVGNKTYFLSINEITEIPYLKTKILGERITDLTDYLNDLEDEFYKFMNQDIKIYPEFKNYSAKYFKLLKKLGIGWKKEIIEKDLKDYLIKINENIENVPYDMDLFDIILNPEISKIILENRELRNIFDFKNYVYICGEIDEIFYETYILDNPLFGFYCVAFDIFHFNDNSKKDLYVKNALDDYFREEITDIINDMMKLPKSKRNNFIRDNNLINYIILYGESLNNNVKENILEYCGKNYYSNYWCHILFDFLISELDFISFCLIERPDYPEFKLDYFKKFASIQKTENLKYPYDKKYEFLSEKAEKYFKNKI